MRPEMTLKPSCFALRFKQRRATLAASPFVESLLAAQTEALQQVLITLNSCGFEVIEQFATTCDHKKEATTCGVIFFMRSKMLREVIDPLRQESHLDVGAAGVLVVDLEGGGIDGSYFAHGVVERPDNLSGSVSFRM